MSTSRRDLEPSALELIEESVHLLRRAPPAALAIYFAGTVPFILGILFFWAYTTWFLPTRDDVAWSALGLVLLFAVMKAAQAAFCARLMALRLGAAPAHWVFKDWIRVAMEQLRLQPWAFLVGIISFPLGVPFGWVYAYGQNLSVLGQGERLHADAIEQAKLWPGQNHIALLMLSGIALVGWLNAAAAFLAVPWLANRLLGIENVFGLTGWWFFNTTFLASVTALTWLAVDPLVKAFYTLRVFYGRARRTGEDVRVALQLSQRSQAGLRIATLAAMMVLCPSSAWCGEAAVAVGAQSQMVRPAELEASIDHVLEGSDFRWRMRPEPGRGDQQPEGVIQRFVRRGVEIIGGAMKAVGRFIGDVADWIGRLFRSSGNQTTSTGTGALTTLKVVLYLFIAGAILLMLWVGWLLVRGARRGATPVVGAIPVASATPDLRDANVQAAQLPVDGWLALAREQADRGEWRLALRAVYLATLARLAAEGHVSLAIFKTNLDYEREVRRRALSRPEVAARFAARRREFEDVWYGHANAGEAPVRAWLAELERSTSP